MKNNIGLLILRFPYESATGMGGEENHILSLARIIREKGDYVKIITSCKCMLKEIKNMRIPYRRTWGGMDIVSIKSLVFFPFTFIFIIINLLRLLLYERVYNNVRVVYLLTYIEKIILTPFALFLGIKVVWGQHTKPGRWFYKNPFKIFYLILSRFVTVIVPSKDMKKIFEKNGVKNLKVIPNGLDIDRLNKIQLKEKPKILRRIFQCLKDTNPGIERNKFDITKIVGCISRLSKEKGILTFLNAVQNILNFRNDIIFLVVGEGKERSKINEIIIEKKLQDNVFLLGYKDQAFLKNFLYVIDFFVLPSPYETFGISVLESFYMKKSVIVSRSGGLKDYVVQRVNGLFFTPGDYIDLGKNIEYLLKNKALTNQMGQNGYKTLIDKYTLEKIYKEWQKVLYF